ncbi:MAG TPA: AI-2E family transporter [Cyclobacteriaceae bacterium]|nr:AI-2E family transporter [Cyclobacteriaceae bacterium]HMV08445.1 AI-2E family transporter [Cyclobacteriaceae bacterium]HMV91180.1 AI-2E family transporter [Cyclobacteriaceae bacterium]HMX01218.1 AI-2E family transporter [Cyclobacteriaceae bacterium]HMX50621.1 AI-2E family transporter [Cyclobacteriaceae bacterium]
MRTQTRFAIRNLMETEKITFLQSLQIIVYSSLILYVGRSLFVPLSFAVLISFVLYPVCRWLEQKGFGRMMAIVVSITGLMIAVLLIVMLLINQFFGFVEEWPLIHAKLTEAIANVRNFLAVDWGFSMAAQQRLIESVTDQSGGTIVQVLRHVFSASAFSVVMLILVPVYSVLILYYRKTWMVVLAKIFSSEKKEKLHEMIALTIQSYYSFIKGMAIVYLIVGILNSLGLLLLGVPHAILFGFIVAILTFIPYVGIIIGSLLPIGMAWITFDSVWYPAGVVAIFTVVQYLEANIIFPLAVSRKLNVNTLIMLLAIFAGGIIWGMAGMILFVPFVGIARLVADHNPRWKTWSLILGANAEGK